MTWSGVPGENENGRRVIDCCAERGLSLSNTYFEHNSLHNYKRLARGQDGVEVKSMIDRAGKESYAALFVGCEDSKRKGKRSLRSLYCAV